MGQSRAGFLEYYHESPLTEIPSSRQMRTGKKGTPGNKPIKVLGRQRCNPLISQLEQSGGQSTGGTSVGMWRGVRHYIFEKAKSILNLGHFLDPKNILIASWYIKTERLIAFSGITLQYFGEKFNLALTR